MGANNLLVELLVEELPPKALKKLGEAFAVGIAAGLAEAELIDSSQPMPPASFATPRRLAVWLPNVRAKAQDRSETKKLVPVSVGVGSLVVTEGPPSIVTTGRTVSTVSC